MHSDLLLLMHQKTLRDLRGFVGKAFASMGASVKKVNRQNSLMLIC